MPVSSAVLTLSSNSETAAQAIEELAASHFLELGERNGRKLPVVLDTPDIRSSRDLWEWMESLQGVDFADLVFVHFDEDSATCALVADGSNLS